MDCQKEIERLKDRVAELEEMVEWLDERCNAYRDYLEELGYIMDFDEAHPMED